MIIFDDATSHGWTVNLKQKSDAAPAIQQFIAIVKTQFGLLIKEVQINAGGEFKSQELTLFLREQGITILTSIPHMHQKNGHAKRFIHTVMDKAQAMHLDACLTQNLWEFTVDCATHVYNCTPNDWIVFLEPVRILKTSKSHFAIGLDPIELKALHYLYLDLPIPCFSADLHISSISSVDFVLTTLYPLDHMIIGCCHPGCLTAE